MCVCEGCGDGYFLADCQDSTITCCISNRPVARRRQDRHIGLTCVVVHMGIPGISYLRPT